MNRFGFVIHPLKPKDAARRYPVARYVPDSVLELLLRRKKSMIVSFIDGIESRAGVKTEGWFAVCPLTPKMMLSMPLDDVYERILDCTRLLQSEGAEIVGLGAFTSVVGDGGVTIAKHAPTPITTGNSYTVATAIEGTVHACGLVGIDPKSSALAVVGATGSIGKTCARMLAPQFASTLIVGRDLARTEAVAAEIPGSEATTDVREIARADAIISVTSAGADVIFPEHLKPGAVICDVSRPRDVSVRVARERPDVLVIEGGVVKVPGNPNFRFNFGFPPKTAFACMSETIMLALEGRLESYTLGKEVSTAQVEETLSWAKKHGFTLDGFRAFEKQIDNAAIDRARAARSAAAT